MDPALEGQYSMKEVIQVAAIAAMCVQSEADYRPLMADVVQSLVPLVKHHRPTSKGGSCSSFHPNNSPKAQNFDKAKRQKLTESGYIGSEELPKLTFAFYAQFFAFRVFRSLLSSVLRRSCSMWYLDLGWRKSLTLSEQYVIRKTW